MHTQIRSKEEIQQRVAALGEWFQNLNLAGVQTAPNHFLGDYPGRKWQRIEHLFPADLTEKTVLDIGCNAGFHSIEMKRRGAKRVVGIDTDEAYLAQARLAAEIQEVDIELRQLDVYSVAQLEEKFDLVIFMGVLYHLRHPLLALDLLHQHVARDKMVFHSLLRGSPQIAMLNPDYPFEESSVFEQPGYPVLHFVEKRYARDPTNWWIPNRACAEAMLRSSGFEILDRAGEDVYLCQRR